MVRAQIIPVFHCSATGGITVPYPTLVRAEGSSELVGDLLLECTGGSAGSTNAVNVQVFSSLNMGVKIVDSAN